MRAQAYKKPSTYFLAPCYFKPGLTKASMDDIIRFVSKEMNIPKERIINKGRKADQVFARQMVCYLASDVVQIRPLVSITLGIDYDHSSVNHSVSVIRNYLTIKCWQREVAEKMIETFKTT